MRISRLRILTAVFAVAPAAPAASAAAQQATVTRAYAGGDSAGIAKARADSLKYPYTAADVRFMTNMIGHHAQAIVMSRMAPSHGASASVQTLAGRIINAQQDEIAAMQRWLADRRQPVPQPAALAPRGAAATGHDDHMSMAMDHGAMNAAGSASEHTMPMAGMLTAAQLAQLDSARGREFDRLFLQYMIQHHSGATSMVKELFDTYGAGQDETIFKFASDVNVDQTTEIARMQRMLFTVLFERATP